MLTKEHLLSAIDTEGRGYYPYSSEDTFELLRCETTRYSIFRVPVEFVKSFEAFSADAFLRVFDRPSEKDIADVEVTNADRGAIAEHLRWLDSSDEPASLKYKSIALRGLESLDTVVRIQVRDPMADLIVAKTADYYVSFFWFTTG